MAKVPDDSKEYFTQSQLPPPEEPTINIVSSPTGSVVKNGSLSSPGFRSDRSGWSVNSDGTAEFSEVSLRGNLVANGIYFDKQFIFTFFESADGWTKSASGVSTRLGGTALQANLSTTYLRAEIFGSANKIDWGTKNPVFASGVIFDHNTAQTIYFGLGNLSVGSPANGVGFKNLNGSVYAVAINNDTQTTVLVPDILTDVWHNYRVNFSSLEATAFYYVDNRLVAIINTNTPTGTDPVLMDFRLQSTEAVNKAMYLTFASFQQDR